jgi:peptide/nickel transport system permease protein
VAVGDSWNAVAPDILERLPATIALASIAFAASMLLGALIGFGRARARAAALRTGLTVLQLLVRAIPVVMLVLFLQMLVIVSGTPMPGAGLASADGLNLGDRLGYLLLPALCLTVPFSAWASLLFYDVFRVPSAAPFRQVGGRIAVGASAIGPALLAATLVCEPMFAWPGVGRVFFNALTQHEPGPVAGLLLLYLAALVLLALCARFAPMPPRAPASERVGLSAIGVIALGLFLGAVFGAVSANLIAPVGPYIIDQNHWSGYPLAPGIAGHVLGTEENGRDLLARLLFGLRTSLVVAAIATLVATGIGAVVASAAPWFGRRGVLAAGGIRPFAAFPFLLAAIWIAGKTNHAVLSPLGIGLLIGLVAWPAIVPAMRERAPARWGGVVDLAACALSLEVTISSFGAGIQPPTPSLGNMFVNALSNLTLAPWIPIASTVVVVGTLFALYALGEELRTMGGGTRADAAKNR